MDIKINLDLTVAFINISKCDCSFIVASNLLQSVMNEVLYIFSLVESIHFTVEDWNVLQLCVFSVSIALCVCMYMIHINKNMQ